MPRNAAIASAPISRCGSAIAAAPTRRGSSLIGATMPASAPSRSKAGAPLAVLPSAATMAEAPAGRRGRAGARFERRLGRRSRRETQRDEVGRAGGERRRLGAGAEVAADQRHAARRVGAQDLGRLAVDGEFGAGDDRQRRQRLARRDKQRRRAQLGRGGGVGVGVTGGGIGVGREPAKGRSPARRPRRARRPGPSARRRPACAPPRGRRRVGERVEGIGHGERQLVERARSFARIGERKPRNDGPSGQSAGELAKRI